MKNRITKEDLETYNQLIAKEKEILDKILESHNNIGNVFYNGEYIIIQFKPGTPLDSQYLNHLHELVEYKQYTIDTVTIVEEFFKLQYKEQILQLNIQL